MQRPAFWRVPHNKPLPDEGYYVQSGSPAERELRRGDIVTKVGDYDARDIRHEDAQTLFANAGNTISVAIQREHTVTQASSRSGSSQLPQSPVPAVKPPVTGGVATPFVLASNALQQGAPRPSTPSFLRAFSPSLQQNRPSSPVVFPPPLPGSDGEPFEPLASRQQHVHFRPLEGALYNHTEDNDEENINNQPYRTTPLVLPGAKMKKDASSTSSYLRHHPNPMFRQTPGHYDATAEVLMKQKVADTVLQRVVGDESPGSKVVHKQFNSPIGLYSDQNIAETIQSQTGATPTNAVRPMLNPRNQVRVSMKKTVAYDPAKSETFKALRESEMGDNIQEVTVPVQTRVFAPNRVPPSKKPAPPPQQGSFVNSLGNCEEIHQSGSFKRLMNSVMGESEF